MSDTIRSIPALALAALISLTGPSFAAESRARKAENEIVVTLGGFRWQELFDEADESFPG